MAHLSGNLDGVNGPVVEGWAFGENLYEAKLTKVHLYIDGQYVTDRLCNFYREDLQTAGVGEGKGFHAFCIFIPPQYLDGKAHLVDVRFASNGLSLPGSPKTFLLNHEPSASTPEEHRITGSLDGFHDGYVEGWAWRGDEPQAHLQVEVFVDQHTVASAVANVFRADLKEAGIGEGDHAFWIPLSGAFLHDGLEHEISVQAGDMTLPNAPLTFKSPPPAVSPTAEQAAAPALRAGGGQPFYEGNFERVSGHIIFGWAWDTKAAETTQNVDLFIDNTFVRANAARNFRADLLRAKKGTGKHGFNFEIPERYFDGRVHTIDIRISGTDISLKGSPKQVRLGPAGVPHPCGEADRAGALAEFYTVSPAVLYSPRKGRKPSSSASKGLVSIIVLTRNGAHLLDEMLHSFVAHNSHETVEFIVVDHASEDDTLSRLEAWKARLPMRIIANDENYSFAYSNNRAAELAKGQYLLLLNNDVVFNQDVIGPMVEMLADDRVGLVGAKLLDIGFYNGTVAYPQIQHLGIHFAVDRLARKLVPHDIHLQPETAAMLHRTVSVPAATGAALMTRRKEFLDAGGFCEAYFYGYEDVDLGLTFSQCRGQQVVVANRLALLHYRGYSRFNVDEAFSQRASGNYAILLARFGYMIRREFLRSLFEADQTWTERPLHVAFAVTEASMSAVAGDYFTAWELGDELRRQFGWKIYYLAKDRHWFDLTDMDVLIVMRDDYDLTKIEHAKPNLVKIAWARNWFPRWGERPWFHRYDLCLCSSQKAAEYIRTTHEMRTGLLRIGGNPERFKPAPPEPGFASDYCFTGSYFKHQRDIIEALQPARLPYAFALYGHDWQTFEQFTPYYRGGLPYADIPKVYASTKMLLDDANHVTKAWGSTNSRVFDALCAGVLVITNCEASSRETFGGLLPVYHDRADLEALVTRYMEQAHEREELTAQLREMVLERHTYAVRAREFHAQVKAFFTGRYRIALKIGAPKRETMHEWGDYHFALAMKRAFEQHGHVTRIDLLPEWDHPGADFDDVVIVLRGLSAYTPKAGQINLMWNISHPDAVTDEEYEGYDHVFMASEPYATQLATRLRVPVTPLLQCTDPQLFHAPPLGEAHPHELLFVGNSRKVYRRILKDAVDAGIPVDVYGTHWEGFLPAGYLQGEHIRNRELHRHYAGATIVLNDHWEHMAKLGFLSNRLFDAGACGAFIISDEVAGLADVFGKAVVTYKDADDLRKKVRYYRQHAAKRLDKARQLRDSICEQHTFDHRVEAILQVIDAFHQARMTGARGDAARSNSLAS